MPRESTISYEQVADLADRLKAEGNRPSARKIRPILGTGSMDTIQDHLEEWRRRQAAQETPPSPRAHPAPLLAEIDRAITAAETLVRQELDAELQDVRSELVELTAAIKISETNADALAEELDKRTRERDSLVATLEVRAEQLEQARQELAMEGDNYALATENMRLVQAEAQERAVAAEVPLETVRQELERLVRACSDERGRREEAERRAVTAETRLEGARELWAGLEEQVRDGRSAAQLLQDQLQQVNARLEAEKSRVAAAQATQQALEKEVALLRELLQAREEPQETQS